MGDPQAYLWLARGSGWLSLLTLSLTLCVTPLSRAWTAGRSTAIRYREVWAKEIPNCRTPSLVRRRLGVTSAALAALHAACGSFYAYDGHLSFVVEGPHMRAGLSALLILSILGATSFPSWVHALHVRPWKELHRLAYVAFACAVQHTLLSPFAPRRWVLGLMGLTLVVGALRLLGAGRRS